MTREYEIKCHTGTLPEEISKFSINTNQYGTFVKIPDEDFQHTMFLLKSRYDVWFSDYRYGLNDECPVGVSIMILPYEKCDTCSDVDHDIYDEPEWISPTIPSEF